MRDPARELPRYPHRPLSEVEWEDLLLRIEIMPRALRVAMDDAERGSAAVERVLEALAAAESWASEFLEAAISTAEGAGPADRHVLQAATPQDDVMDRFVRLRTRNFAMAQRRGIAVWDWEAAIGGGGRATVHQLFAFLADSDAKALRALRATTRESGIC